LKSDSNTDGDEDSTTDDGSTDGDEDSTTDDGSTDGDEDSTKSYGSICVEIVVDEYRIVENQEANLTAEISGATADEVSFEWFVSGESFGGNTQSIEYVFDEAGDYRVSVRVTEDATGDIVECTPPINEEDETSDTIPINEESEYSYTLSINEEDWTEDEEDLTEDREIIFSDLIVKTYNDDGNPINATVKVDYISAKVGHTTEWQVNADRTANVFADDYTNCDCVARNAPRDSPGWEKYREKYVRNNEWKIDAKKTVSVAEGETKTVELTLTNISVPSRGGDDFDEGGVPSGDGGGDFEEAEDNPNYPEDNGVGGVLFGDGGGGGDGDGGISAAITLSILVAAGLVIILGGFWLFNLLAAVVGGEQGINGLGRIGRIIRRKDD